ncbi:MAG: hypothetical protein AAF720_09040 [Pseudomonadota bacterium]
MTITDSSNLDQNISVTGEEELRFIRNFHDVFLSVGLFMLSLGVLLVSVLIIGESAFSGSLSGSLSDSVASIRGISLQASIVFFIDAALMWVLAEIFARARRLFLPSIVILMAFTGFFAVSAFYTFITLFANNDLLQIQSILGELKYLALWVGGGSTVAILIYYIRMKLPFAMGLAGVGVVATAVGTLFSFAPGLAFALGPLILVISGLFLFVLGVVYDARDPARRTRYSDNGFWLHFFAAPLIFTGVINAVVGSGGPTVAAVSGSGISAAIMTLLVVTFFAIVSLVINRRALLVSGLLSALIAVGVLVRSAGLSAAWVGGLTLLILGLVMVILGGAWHSLRRIVISPFPTTGFWARIIPPEDIDSEDSRTQVADDHIGAR